MNGPKHPAGPPQPQPFAHLALDFTGAPTLVVDAGGSLVVANSEAHRAFGPNLVGRPLAGLLERAPEALLAQAAASTAPMMAAVTLAGTGPGRRRQVRLARLLRDPGAPPLVVVHFAGDAEARFERLRDTVRNLQGILRDRAAEQAELNAALEHNQLLYRELQHRLKNNIHLIGVLLRLSARDHASAEVQRVVDTALARIQAMGRTQEAIYDSRDLGTVQAGPFIDRIVRGLGASMMPFGRIATEIEDVAIQADAAHNLALIVNELATNAMKYGRQDTTAELRVRLDASAATGFLELEIADNGPGFEPKAAARSSGLTLVEALVEQLGGRMALAPPPVGGTCWRIKLPRDGCLASGPAAA